MKIIKEDYKNINIKENLTCALGNFDGIHLGHQELIKEVKKYNDTKSAVLFFTPHTKSLFNKNFKELFSEDDKIEKLKKYNLDYIIIVSFTKSFANFNINKFINFLKKINIKRVVVGSDFRFSNKALGTPKDILKEIETIIIPKLRFENKEISSTLIKELLLKKDFKKIKKLLGENYYIKGEVISGNRVGRSISFPTANINYKDILLPPNGVYITKTSINSKTYYAMTNIGHNPTINYHFKKRLETHLIGFNGNLYGKTIKIEFLSYLRSEIKFNSKKELINKLNEDKIMVIRYFNDKL